VRAGDAMTEPTAETVRAFYAHMSSRFGATVVPKASSSLMSAAGWGLGALRSLGASVPDAAAFASRYVTTIGSTVYVPYEPGDESTGWSRWDQIGVIVHECEHVAQRGRMGLAYERDWLTSTAARARLEAEAYRVQLELEHWHRGYVPADMPGRLARMLRDYGCSDADVAVTERVLRSSAVSVRQGAVISEAAHVAILWLDEHAPELRAPGVPSRRPS